MKLFGSPVATTVGYGHFHSVPATFLYMLRVEFADQIAADGIGLAEQSVFPVYRSAVTVYSGFFILGLEGDAPRTPPLSGVERNYLRRHGIYRYRISAQVADTDFHETVLVSAAYTVFSAPRRNTGYVILRFIFQTVAPQADAHLARSVQRDNAYCATDK